MNVQKNQITLLIALVVSIQAGFAHGMEAELENSITTHIKSDARRNFIYGISLAPVMLLSLIGHNYIEANHPNNGVTELGALVAGLQIAPAIGEICQCLKLANTPQYMMPIDRSYYAKAGCIIRSATCCMITMIIAVACLYGKLETHSDAIGVWCLGAIMQAVYAYHHNKNVKADDDLVLLIKNNRTYSGNNDALLDTINRVSKKFKSPWDML